MNDPKASNEPNPAHDSQPERLHHIDAVHFVHHGLRHAGRDRQAMRDGRISGEGLCRVLLELAVDEFGAQGAEILMKWNVHTSDDIGLIVSRMRDADVPEAALVASNADFSDWFDLRQPAQTWKLQW